MLFSIIIPFHKNNNFITESIASCIEQTFKDFEIVLVPNGEVLKDTAFLETLCKIPKVKMFPFEYAFDHVGAVKRYGFMKAKGDYGVELDFDDLLTPDCLEKLKIEIDKDQPDFIFSNFCQVDLAGNTANPWSPYYGWSYRDYTYKGKVLKETISPEFIPQNISRIWFNANHVRVWKMKFYKEIGGHDLSMRISDDHDLVLRSYLKGNCRFIDDCLYIYRVHKDNTTWLLNQEIQDTMWLTYDRYIWKLIEKWADDNKLRKIDLAGGINPAEGYENYDLRNAQIIGDLDKDWKLKDNSVGILRANDAIEHFKDPIHTMNEAHRVLAHGGYFMINVPSTDGRGAFCDPTHKSFWNIRSFEYYTKANMRKFIEPECKCEFQIMKLNNGTQYSDKVPYVFAHLIALKDGLRFHGAYDWYRERTTLSKGVDVPLYENARYEWAKSMVKGKTILEIGCSNGYGSQYFEGFDYLGIDNSQPIIDSAIKEYGNKFQCADIHDFKLGQYDNIVIFECLEHLEDGIELAQKLKKHCKQLIASVPYNENKGDLGGHHKIHNLTEKDFPNFEYKFMRKDGKIYDSPDKGFNLMLLRASERN